MKPVETRPSEPFTRQPLAKHRDCGAWHIRNLIEEGELPVFRLGK